MARPQRKRRICKLPAHTCFEPDGINSDISIALSLDEFETIRLVDLYGLTHGECADVMQISRTTATEIYASARKKLAAAIVKGYRLTIEGGNVRLCDPSADRTCILRAMNSPQNPNSLCPLDTTETEAKQIDVLS